MNKETTPHLVVIGGGAAGIFCAVNAARLNRSLKVTVIEKTNKLLAKVKVSGGGRCNVTNACFDIQEMSSNYPRGGNFVKKAFHQFFTDDTIKWFQDRPVILKTEADGRVFPESDDSQTIIDLLLKEAGYFDVKFRMSTEVKNIAFKNERWEVITAKDDKIAADYICVACGGYPKSSMFDWLKNIGHTIEEPVPSLFTFNMPKHPITQLRGVSVNPVRVKIIGTKLEETGPLLITHWGLSGPAILKLSAWGARDLAACQWNFSIMVNWLPDFNEQTLAEQFRSIRVDKASQKIENKNPFNLPQRLWEFLLEQSGIKNDIRWADLPAANQNKLIKNLCSCQFDIKGKTTYKEEFVTAGGIKLSEVDANTMMSKKVPNLYFAGEILDVDGITGGFNFQHAWTSGYVAASSIVRATKNLELRINNSILNS